MDIDVLIVGLGPAGATVLSKLAKLVSSEISILGIDKRPKPGFPVQCGEFMPSPKEMAILMPGVPNTNEFFTFKKEFISTPTNRISFFSPHGKVIDTPFDGYTIHRGEWNTHLIKTAMKHGAEVWTSACAIGMKNGQIFVSQNEKSPVKINPKIIVGADGANSRISKWTGLAEIRTPHHFVVTKQHVMTDISSELYNSTDVQMFFGEKYAPGAYAWIIPKNDYTANVGVGIRTPMLKGSMTISKALSNLINVHPVANKILKSARIKHTIGGLVPVGFPFKNSVDLKSKTLLVGDASCQVVSSVGAGIPTSMAAGTIAAETIMNYFLENRSLNLYQSEWQKQMQKTFKQAYKLRQFFDKISTRDSKIQWYMNRLGSSDIDKVVHCSVPWKVSLANPLIRFLNLLIK
ncbi:MAG: geranylgeranyl reductase family protein [Candidatus Hodarchaeota archaeon]